MRRTRKAPMSRNSSLTDLLETIPSISRIDATPDKVNSISSAVVRCLYDGERAVAVGSDTKKQIGALLDLVDLHLHGGGRIGDLPVRGDRVTCLIWENSPVTEAIDALRRLVSCLRAPFEVRLLRMTSDGTLH